jgi:hypothetical protein
MTFDDGFSPAPACRRSISSFTVTCGCEVRFTRAALNVLVQTAAHVALNVLPELKSCLPRRFNAHAEGFPLHLLER